MELPISQLQRKLKVFTEALKRGETVALMYHGRVLARTQPSVNKMKKILTKDQKEALAATKGMWDDLGETQALYEKARQGRSDNGF